jgi:hypothetical protein
MLRFSLQSVRVQVSLPASFSINRKEISMRLIASLALAFLAALPVFSQEVGSVEIAEPENFIVQQERDTTGWAACGRMMLKAIGIAQTEDQLQQRMRLINPKYRLGDTIGANFDKLSAVIGGMFTDNGGRPKLIIPYSTYNDDAQISRYEVLRNSLKKGIPAIAIAPGRVVLIYGAGFYEAWGKARVNWLKVLDPGSATGIPPRFIMLQEGELTEFKGFMTVRFEDPM